MTFIIAIVVVIFYLSLSSRLSTIEHKLKQLNSGAVEKAPVTETDEHEQHVAPVARSTSEVDRTSNALDERAGGKLLAAVGIIAVFLGLAFFLKYAFDNNLIGITGRIVLGYAVGLLAVYLGVSLRKKYPDYADTLSGGRNGSPLSHYVCSILIL